MSIPNGIQPYSYPASQADEFEKKGHPGMFLQSLATMSSQGSIIEISVRSVAVVSGGPVYALIRNQLVR